MEVRKIKFNLDCAKMNNQVNIKGIRQGDANSVQFVITLMQGKKKLELSDDCSTILYAIKPDGNKLATPCEFDEKFNVIYTLHTQDTTAIGVVKYQLVVSRSITKTTQVLASPSFTCNVEKNISNIVGETFVSTDEFSAFIEAIEVSKTATKAANEALTRAKEPVTTEKIADKAVTNNKISNGAITTEKVSDGAITGDKIGNETITLMKLTPELYDEIAGKANFINLGTVSNWDKFLSLKEKTLYFVDTFTGNMNTDIGSGHCFGYCGTDTNVLYLVNITTGLWWMFNVTEESISRMSAIIDVGTKGEDGDSAYQVAVNNGFEGTEEEWLESLKGTDGNDGVSVTNAYILSEKYGSEAGKLVIEFSNDEALILDKVVGDSGVYIGSQEPTDESVDVWIDTSEETDTAVPNEWKLLSIFDLSSGELSYTADTSGCNELMIVAFSTLTMEGSSYSWKGCSKITGPGKTYGGVSHLWYLGGGVITANIPRGDNDTLLRSLFITNANDTNNSFNLTCSTASEGIIRVYGR